MKSHWYPIIPHSSRYQMVGSVSWTFRMTAIVSIGHMFMTAKCVVISGTELTVRSGMRDTLLPQRRSGIGSNSQTIQNENHSGTDGFVIAVDMEPRSHRYHRFRCVFK